MKLKVDCYSGYRGEEKPKRFWIKSKEIKIKKIIDQWLSPDHRYFKILGDDHAIYTLRLDTSTWIWQLSFFKHPDHTYIISKQLKI